MPKLTAQEKLIETKRQTKEAMADLQRKLRHAEAAAKAEAQDLHTKHLWTLAKLLDETGLSQYGVDTLRPRFKDLAVRMEQQAAERKDSHGAP